MEEQKEGKTLFEHLGVDGKKEGKTLFEHMGIDIKNKNSPLFKLVKLLVASFLCGMVVDIFLGSATFYIVIPILIAVVILLRDIFEKR